jgi:chaperone modulatory protein CbpM
MHPEDFIPAGDFCAFHHVELSFVRGLHDSGLIGMIVQDGAVLLPAEELPVLEKFVRWHYELAINSEGIEALSHLLGRMEALQDENRRLRNRLTRLADPGSGPVQPGEEIS